MIVRRSIHRKSQPSQQNKIKSNTGDGTWGISDLEDIRRPIKDEYAQDLHKCVIHALWSDPSDSDEAMARGTYKDVHCF